jgi:hypothetical protein
MSKLSRQRGKSGELAIAKFWGMRRNHFEAEDLTGHPTISVEAKVRKERIVTIDKWVAQADNACPLNRIPVVHFHVLGDDHSGDLVIMYAKELRDIIGTGGKE